MSLLFFMSWKGFVESLGSVHQQSEASPAPSGWTTSRRPLDDLRRAVDPGVPVEVTSGWPVPLAESCHRSEHNHHQYLVNNMVLVHQLMSACCRSIFFYLAASVLLFGDLISMLLFWCSLLLRLCFTSHINICINQDYYRINVTAPRDRIRNIF